MTNTTTETFSWAGVVLNTYANNIESIAGRLQVPGKRTGNVPLPGQHGQMPVSDKMYDQNVISLPMWIKGSDANGAIPGGSSSRKEFFKNHDALCRLFQLPGQQALVWTLADGTQRQCFGEVLDTIDYSADGWGEPMAKFAVSLTLAKPFWQDTAQATDTLVNPTHDGTTQVSLPNLSGGSAPIDDAKITVTGPWNGFTMTDPISGATFGFSTNIPAAQTLVIDCAAFTCLLNGTSKLTSLTHNKPPFMRFQPDASGNVKIIMAGSATTSASQVQVQGFRRWLAG